MSTSTSHIPIDTTSQTGTDIDLDKIINGAESLTKDIINETKEKVKKNRKKKKNKKKKSQEASVDTTGSNSGLQDDKTFNLDSIMVGIEEYLQDNVEGDVAVNINKETPENDAQVKDTSIDVHDKDNSVNIFVEYPNNMNISDNQDSTIANDPIEENTEENTGYKSNSISPDNFMSMIENTSMQEDYLVDGVSNKSKKNKKHKKKKKNKNKKKTEESSEENNSKNKDNEEKKDDIIAVTSASNTDNDESTPTPKIKENEGSIANPDNSLIYSNLTIEINTDSIVDDKEMQQQPNKNKDSIEQSHNNNMTDYEISTSNKLKEGNNNRLVENVGDVTSKNDKNEFHKSEIKEINVPKSQIQEDVILNETATAEDAAVDASNKDPKFSKEIENEYSQQKIEEDLKIYETSQLNSEGTEDMIDTKKEHTALSLLDTASTLVSTENNNSLMIKKNIEKPLTNDNSDRQELSQKEIEGKIFKEDDLPETKSSRNCSKEDAGKQLNQTIDLQEEQTSEAEIPEGITGNSVTESNKLSDEDSSGIESLSNNTEVTYSANLEKQEEKIKLEVSKSELEIPYEQQQEETKEITEKLSDKESPIEEQTCNVVKNDSTNVLDSTEGLSLPEDKNNSLSQEEHIQPESFQSHTITNTSLDDLFAETEALLNNLEYVDDSALNQLLGIGKNSNEKIKNSKNILKSSEIEKINEQEPVYIYTSLAGGGFHMIPRTNRLATILQANRIEFTYRDLGTDAEARKVWKTFSRGRTLPAVVRGRDTIVGNWEEMDEFNEVYRVRQEIYEAL